jgi:hypothetical protein
MNRSLKYILFVATPSSESGRSNKFAVLVSCSNLPRPFQVIEVWTKFVLTISR